MGQAYRGLAQHRTEVAKIYSASAINIDINRIYQSDIVTMRVFDVLASGGFLLTEYTPELESLFVLGKELECYSSISELHDKVDFYLKNPQARQKIAMAGQERVLGEHTISQRIDTMLDTVFMPC